jgi:hypothetical protein
MTGAHPIRGSAGDRRSSHPLEHDDAGNEIRSRRPAREYPCITVASPRRVHACTNPPSPIGARLRRQRGSNQGFHLLERKDHRLCVPVLQVRVQRDEITRHGFRQHGRRDRLGKGSRATDQPGRPLPPPLEALHEYDRQPICHRKTPCSKVSTSSPAVCPKPHSVSGNAWPSLTGREAQRLFGLDGTTCDEILERLRESGFLSRTDDGVFLWAQADDRALVPPMSKPSSRIQPMTKPPACPKCHTSANVAMEVEESTRQMWMCASCGVRWEVRLTPRSER